jgi:3-hydroxyisobutyrate dehydrogenase
MTQHVNGPVGFLGLGVMGQPMALRLLRAGVDLVVWNRTADRCDPLAAAGARAVDTVAEVAARCSTLVVMLADEAAVEQVLGPGGPGFAGLVGDRLLISMGTYAPEFSAALQHEVDSAGGRYVEAPVSGSRAAAEDGVLVAMLAGADPGALDRTEAVLAPLVSRAVHCGPVPSALLTKLTVNSYMITMLTGLAEAVHLGDRLGLDRAVLSEVLLGGTLASPVLVTKLGKLVDGDHTAQAAITDVAKNTRLITAAAAGVGAAAPLAEVCRRLFAEAVAHGLGGDDLIAVIRSLEARPVP